MLKRLTTLFALAFFLCVSVAQAQVAGEAGRFFVKLDLGASTYGGDRDRNPDDCTTSNCNGTAGYTGPTRVLNLFGRNIYDGSLKTYIEDARYRGGLEFGYNFSKRLGVALGLNYAKYERIDALQNWGSGSVLPANGNGNRLNGNLLFYLTPFTGKVSPYLMVGANVTQAADNSGETVAYGPSWGAGLKFNLSNKLAFMIDGLVDQTYSDRAVDNADPGSNNDDTPWDRLSRTGLGLMLNVGAPSCVPSDIMSIAGPTTANINEAVTFTGTANNVAGTGYKAASAPVVYTWTADGEMPKEGLSATYSFATKGSKTVKLAGTNCGGLDSVEHTINVINPCDTNQPSIASSNAPAALTAGQSGSFSSRANGTGVTYRWDFGNGATASTANASQTFTRPGTYAVKLTVTNSCGSETKEFSVRVNEAVVTPPPVTCSISTLNSVYFDYGATTLNTEAKAKLDENIAELKKPECSSVKIKVCAGSDSAENSPRLAEQRARAIADYYIASGVASASVMTSTCAPVPDCDKEDPGRGCRRARFGNTSKQ